MFFHAADMPERRYTQFSTPGSLALPFDVLEQEVVNFLDCREQAKPLFLYVNYHDTHFPYSHSGIKPLISNEALRQDQIQPEMADELRSTYLNTLSNVDAARLGASCNG